jgi:hypothetical protein
MKKPEPKSAMIAFSNGTKARQLKTRTRRRLHSCATRGASARNAMRRPRRSVRLANPPAANNKHSLACLAGDIRNVLSKRRGKINLMILFLRQDLADLFRHGEFA